MSLVISHYLFLAKEKSVIVSILLSICTFCCQERQKRDVNCPAYVNM